MASPNPEQVATAFVQHYYHVFDTARHSIGSLYKESSMLTWENNKFVGAAAIQEKLNSITDGCAHQIGTVDVQPSVAGGAIIVFVTGDVKIGGPESNPLKFSQMFQLVPTGPGAFYVHNDIFRFSLS